MFNQNNLLVAIVAIAASAVTISVYNKDDAGSDKTSGQARTIIVNEEIATPTAEMQSVVSPIISIAKQNRLAALEASDFYLAASRVIGNDTAGTIKTTSQIRNWVQNSESLIAKNISNQTGTQRLPELPQAIDKALTTTVGKEDKQVDAAMRAKISETLRAVAWALSQ